jgi:hypothetical protein
MTISESLFEAFCRTNHFVCKRIEESSVSGKREPDYELYTESVSIVVEVKQFDLNEEEKKQQKQLEKLGQTDVYGKEPGAKVRLKIQSGRRQLKARSGGKKPTLLVLYNNVPINNRGVDPYEIMTAMYGIEKFGMKISSISGEVTNEDCGFGPKRKMTQTSNTSISAIASLNHESNGKLTMRIFHNIHAAVPLPVEVFQRPTIRHFTLGKKEHGCFQNWGEIKPLQDE